MSVKLSSIYYESKSEFLVEFQAERDFVEEELIEIPLSLEELFEQDDRFRDIVRNIANQDVADIDPLEYQDRVKEELIADGMLKEDNFIDEQKNLLDELDEGDTAIAESEEQKDTSLNKLSANELAALYDGPTRVFYYLEGRYQIELPIPIYKCENSGIIVINIIVERNGRISDYSINRAESSTNDPCLSEAAISAIKRTFFNPDITSDKKQNGTITYQFIEQ